MQRQISKITKVADGYQMMTAVDSKISILVKPI